MSAPPSSSSKSWWSRSKSAKDVPALRTRPSILSLGQDAKGQSSSSASSSRSKEHGSGSKFNSFVASAIGRKHKKPTLTIQDPPPPLITSFSSRSVHSGTSPSTATSPSQSYFVHRPPAKSVSTVRSYEHDMDQGSDYHTISEPRTPSDHPRDRRSYQNSLLTLSDPDPFAAGAVIVSRFDQDPNRLSVYSDSSLLDPNAKRGDMMPVNRMSYGSSSSNSHGNPDTQGAYVSYQPVARIPSDGSAADKRHNRETSVFLDTPFADLPTQLSALQSGSTASRVRVMSAASSSAIASRPPNGAAQDPAPPAPVRQRGMTVAGEHVELLPLPGPSRPTISPYMRRRPSDFSSRSDSPATTSTATPSPIIFHSSRSSVSTSSTATPVPLTRPLVLVRKASSSRVNIPPLNTAPPTTRLPPPPPSPFSMSELEESLESLVFPDVPSSSSSSLSFASIHASGDEILNMMRDTFMDAAEERVPQTVPQTQSPPAIPREFDQDPRRKPTTSLLSSKGRPSTGDSSKSVKKAVSTQNFVKSDTGTHQQ
ncbi:hypothetical protein NM688_g7555 [Phlebia brevispora]|uniref:Uncharacterized protein n=1 Tax=Phlebia brevispora TaxID=194682 RepID=A0ACC1S466_9APHY|nr:hypothetical protein NM688_g7555 [Phlebia brevispora]